MENKKAPLTYEEIEKYNVGLLKRNDALAREVEDLRAQAKLKSTREACAQCEENRALREENEALKAGKLSRRELFKCNTIAYNEINQENKQLRAQLTSYQDTKNNLILERNALEQKLDVAREAIANYVGQFNKLKEKQDKLLKNGFAEACGNWTEATSDDFGLMDVEPLMKALAKLGGGDE